MVFMSFRPIVADTVCKDGSVSIEAGGRDRSADIVERLDPLLDVLVPERNRAVGTRCAERSVGWME